MAECWMIMENHPDKKCKSSVATSPTVGAGCNTAWGRLIHSIFGHHKRPGDDGIGCLDDPLDAFYLHARRPAEQILRGQIIEEKLFWTHVNNFSDFEDIFSSI